MGASSNTHYFKNDLFPVLIFFFQIAELGACNISQWLLDEWILKVTRSLFLKALGRNMSLIRITSVGKFSWHSSVSGSRDCNLAPEQAPCGLTV